MSTEIANVIELRKSRPMVSSLKIAELFGRRHDNVLAAIRKIQESQTGLLISKETGTDSQGKERPVFWLDEESALVIMPFIGGRKAVEGQRKLVQAYLYYRDHFANPPRKDILAAKRAAHHPMMDALIEARADDGKDTESKHFTCENRLCNWVVTGKFAAIDKSALSNEELDLLRRVRERNAAFIASGLTYDVRKPKLAAYGLKLRNRAVPRLAA